MCIRDSWWAGRQQRPRQPACPRGGAALAWQRRPVGLQTCQWPQRPAGPGQAVLAGAAARRPADRTSSSWTADPR
eukprot:10674089-Alexandrium_andersonii.AAC.1